MTDHDEMTGCAAWDQWARDAAAAAALRIDLGALSLSSARGNDGPGGPPSVAGGAAAMSMRVSPAWDEHVDAVRRRSHELAVRRGHVRRFP